MIINRIIYNKIKKELFNKDKNVIIIYGPRQVGKTTIIKELIKDIGKPVKYFSGDDLFAQNLLSRNELESLKRIFSNEQIAVVDEAQKIKNIGLTLKLLHDNTDIRLITSGSASFDLADKISEPLTGRTKTFWLYPLSYAEVKEKYKIVSDDLALEEMLRYGFYPKVQTINRYEEKESYLYEYINNYLYKDILEFSGVRKPKKVIDLLAMLALQIGSEVSIAELSKNLTLSQKAVEHYLDILEKMFVIVNIRGFSRNLRKEIYKMSKYFFMDIGLRNALIRNFNSLNLRSDTGALFENFFIMEKIKYAQNSGRIANFYFWRTYDQKEIDLIEERGGKLVGYECKFSLKKSIAAPLDWQRAYPNAKFELVTPENFKKYLTL